MAIHLNKLVVFLCVLLFIMPVASQAQEDGDLSDEDIALLELFVEAKDIPTTYASAFVDYQTRSYTQTILEYPDSEIRGGHVAELAFQGVVIQRETDGFDAQGILIISEHTTTETDDADTVDSYLLSNNLVMIDGVLYLQSEYLDSGGDTSKLEEDVWLEIEDADAVPPELAESTLDGLLNFLNITEAEDAITLLFSDVELLKPYVTVVYSEEVTSDDDQAVQYISIQIDGEQFAAFVQTYFIEPYWDFAVPVDAEHIQGRLEADLTLNADGLVDHYQFQFILYLEDIDLHALDANEPENSVLNMNIELEQIIYFVDINAEVEPIVVPE